MYSFWLVHARSSTCISFTMAPIRYLGVDGHRRESSFLLKFMTNLPGIGWKKFLLLIFHTNYHGLLHLGAWKISNLAVWRNIFYGRQWFKMAKIVNRLQMPIQEINFWTTGFVENHWTWHLKRNELFFSEWILPYHYWSDIFNSHTLSHRQVILHTWNTGDSDLGSGGGDQTLLCIGLALQDLSASV